jgi:NAD(P)-dependent dehydrogenase (short-subunit alcohol dehydrogenase family)
MNPQQYVWLITGVSGGLGRALAEYAARQNDIVVGTVRKRDQLKPFNDLVKGQTFAQLLDVTDPESIRDAVTAIGQQHGRIDVLVNNAGYGLLGAVEEIDLTEARDQMETNFFGLFLMTKEVLPGMRKQNFGRIVQISSAAGIMATPGMGLYNASKFAVEGMSEALSFDTAHLNIRVTIVEPGPFRTEFAGTSSRRARNSIAAYEQTAGERIRIIHRYSGKQDGDPRKAASVIYKAIRSPNPPLRLPLGQFAIDRIKEKIALIEKDIAEWREEITKTSFE